MSNAFYLFKIPDVWCPYLAFNVSRAADDLLGVESEEEHYLACGVLPMGWASSVGIMQEVSERILLNHGVPRESQLRRGRAISPMDGGDSGRSSKGIKSVVARVP